MRFEFVMRSGKEIGRTVVVNTGQTISLGRLKRSDVVVEDEAASMAKASAGGGKVVAVEDRAAWEAGARGVWAALAPKVGGLDKIEAIAKTS